jgi:ankyrin repeat protein
LVCRFVDVDLNTAVLLQCDGNLEQALQSLLPTESEPAPPAPAQQTDVQGAAEHTPGERTVRSTAEAVRALLPPPPAVQYWLDGGMFYHNYNASASRNDEATAAAEWLVEAVAHAHLSPAIKAAGRALMQQPSFTANLETFNVYAPSSSSSSAPGAGCTRIGSVWTHILIPQLHAKLVQLGEDARAANARANIVTELGSAAVAACSTMHPAYPPGTRARQDDAMPDVAAQFDFEHGWKDRPEQVYIHTLCLVALVLDPLFATELTMVASDVDGAVNVHAAQTKSYSRMAGKMAAADDHRYVPHPRPARNIDIVRRLAVVETTAAARQLITGVSARFGGLSYLKCLADLGDGPAAAARYHMLPTMLTVEFAPEEWTVGRMIDDPQVQVAWEHRRATRPGSVSGEQWVRDHDAAVAALRRVDRAVQLKQHCEVQLVLKPMAEIRHAMHELYKVKRADSGALLLSDVAKPEEGGVDGQDLVGAANDGRIVTVERLLALAIGGRGSGDEGAATARRYVNQRTSGAPGGPTALYMAAQGGHLAVVRVLLASGADPAIAMLTDGATPVWVAAHNGHLDVVRMLTEARANVNTAKTITGATPVFVAAQYGHLDVVGALVDSGADVNVARTGNGDTPVYIAAQQDNVGVVRLLVEAGANVNAATTDDGSTPVFMAAQHGHLEVVRVLVEAGANVNAVKTTDGCTPVFIAAFEGHLDIVLLLVQAGADVNAATTINGATPVLVAARNGHLDVAGVLIEVGADIHAASTDNGSTPVFMAAQKGHTDVVRLLLEASANPSTPLFAGVTPLELAQYQNFTGIVDLLKEFGA